MSRRMIHVSFPALRQFCEGELHLTVIYSICINPPIERYIFYRGQSAKRLELMTVHYSKIAPTMARELSTCPRNDRHFELWMAQVSL